MKATERIRAVRFDNRKRVLHLDYASGKHIEAHYGHLGITQKVVEVWVDKETRGHAIGIRLQDGREEYMPYDQPLALARDPEYLLRTQLERVLARVANPHCEGHLEAVSRHAARNVGQPNPAAP